MCALRREPEDAGHLVEESPLRAAAAAVEGPDHETGRRRRERHRRVVTGDQEVNPGRRGGRQSIGGGRRAHPVGPQFSGTKVR